MNCEASKPKPYRPKSRIMPISTSSTQTENTAPRFKIRGRIAPFRCTVESANIRITPQNAIA